MPASDIVVMQIPSHLEASEVCTRRLPSWMVQGNQAVNELAGEAARAARVPEEDRHRVLMAERKALHVRRRLLRAAVCAIRF
eukprot:2746483-Pyramimonas_sp.AAC.1